MASLTLRAHGPVDAVTAWERYADPRAWSIWAPQIQRVETVMARLAPGGTGVVRAGVLPWPTVPVRFEVLDVDEEARTWSWRARVGPATLRLTHGVESAPSGSSSWLRVVGPLPVVLGYAPVAQLALHRLLSRPPA